MTLRVNKVGHFFNTGNATSGVNQTLGERGGDYSPRGDFLQQLSHSLFALVPRGHALFSYRLTEALSAGAIPVRDRSWRVDGVPGHAH